MFLLWNVNTHVFPTTEQYDTFVKFTHDQLMRRFGEQPASCEYMSCSHVMQCVFQLCAVMTAIQEKKWLRSDCGTNRLYPHIQWKPYINLIKYTKFKLCLNFSTDVIALVTELLSHQQMFPEFHHQTSGIIVCSFWGAVAPTLTSLPPGCALLPPWTSLPQAASSWLLQFCRVWVWRRVSCCQRVGSRSLSRWPPTAMFIFIWLYPDAFIKNPTANTH